MPKTVAKMFGAQFRYINRGAGRNIGRGSKSYKSFVCNIYRFWEFVAQGLNYVGMSEKGASTMEIKQDMNIGSKSGSVRADALNVGGSEFDGWISTVEASAEASLGSISDAGHSSETDSGVLADSVASYRSGWKRDFLL